MYIDLLKTPLFLALSLFVCVCVSVCACVLRDTNKSCVITFINTPIIVTHSGFSVFFFCRCLSPLPHLFLIVCYNNCLRFVAFFLFFSFHDLFGRLIVILNNMHFVQLPKTGTPQTILRIGGKQKTNHDRQSPTEQKSRRQLQRIRLICYLIFGNFSPASIEFEAHDDNAGGMDRKKNYLIIHVCHHINNNSHTMTFQAMPEFNDDDNGSKSGEKIALQHQSSSFTFSISFFIGVFFS